MVTVMPPMEEKCPMCKKDVEVHSHSSDVANIICPASKGKSCHYSVESMHVEVVEVE